VDEQKTNGAEADAEALWHRWMSGEELSSQQITIAQKWCHQQFYAEARRNSGVRVLNPKAYSRYQNIVRLARPLAEKHKARLTLRYQKPSESTGLAGFWIRKRAWFGEADWAKFCQIIQQADQLEIHAQGRPSVSFQIGVRELWAEPPGQAQLNMDKQNLAGWYMHQRFWGKIDTVEAQQKIADIAAMTPAQVLTAFKAEIDESRAAHGITEEALYNSQMRTNFESDTSPEVFRELRTIDDTLSKVAAQPDQRRYDELMLVCTALLSMLMESQASYHDTWRVETDGSDVHFTWEGVQCWVRGVHTERLQYVAPMINTMLAEPIGNDRIRFTFTIKGVWPHLQKGGV
jgi:hypothetical protein